MTGGRLETHVDDGIVTARLHGEIDLQNADELARELTAEIPNAALGVVVDLSGVTYLDSSGVRMLFDISDRLRGRQQALRVVAPPGVPLRRVLTLVDLPATVPILETVDAAVDDIRGSA